MKRIIILSSHAYGDTFLSLSAVKQIRNQFDKVEINLLTHKRMDFGSRIKIDSQFTLQKKTFFNIIKIIFFLRRKKYDYAFLFIPNRTNTLIYFFLKAKNKLGFIKLIKSETFHLNDWTLYDGMRKTKIKWKKEESYLDFIRLTLDYTFKKMLVVEKPKSEKIRIINNDTIVLHYTSSLPERTLNVQTVLEICKYLEQYYDIQVIIVGQDLNEFEKKVESFLNKTKVLDNLTYDELENCILSARFFIGVDSFPLHIADANNIPLLGLFCDTNPNSVLVHKNYFVIRTSLSHLLSPNELTDIKLAIDKLVSIT